MDPYPIDWHKTGLLVAVVAAGLLMAWVAWRVLRIVVRVFLLLLLLAVVSGVVAWWVQRH